MEGYLSVESLGYALAVSETGSFNSAAQSFGITQPSLSTGIARLEEHLGERLFTRSRRGAVPTEFGLRMLPLMAKVVAAADALESEATRWVAPAESVLRMGVAPMVNPELVAAVHRAVAGSAANASTELVMREANAVALKEALLAGELDVVLVPSLGPLPRYERVPIGSEPLVLLDDEDEHTGRPIELNELVGKRLVAMSRTCAVTSYFCNLMASRDLPLETYPGEASNYHSLEEWVGLGLGVAVLPRSRLSEATPYRPILDGGTEVEISYEMIWNPSSPLSGRLRELAESVGRRPGDCAASDASQRLRRSMARDRAVDARHSIG